MQVVVKGKNLEVPDHVRDEAIAKFSRVEKLFDQLFEMEIVLSEENNPRIGEPVHCEAVLHAKGKRLHAEASGADPTAAIDRCESKLARQVRKLKTQLTNRSRGNGRPVDVDTAITDSELAVVSDPED